MTALIRLGAFVVEAYANWGRWVARCGYCPGAEHLQRFAAYFECHECGTITEVIWPSESMVAGVERLLMMRPAPAHRNWVPGETLHDLMFENGAHGIFDHVDQLVDMTPGQVLFGVDDEGIRVDKLPALKPRIRRAVAQ